MSFPAVTCDLCEHRCAVAPGARGRCGIRENRGGRLVTLNYGRLIALAVDPIEKKPLYHFLPGTATLSIALHGCNFTCRFCQNHTISQREFFDPAAGEEVMPDAVVALAVAQGIPSISFTYSEPTVWGDYVVETARAARAAGIRTVMVTNGFFTDAALDRLLPLIDAFNIDLKGDELFYREQCGGAAAPVLRNIARIAADRDKTLEVTTLVIEGLHDADGIVTLGKELEARGVEVWHLSRYHPAYRSRLAATGERFLSEIYERVTRETTIPYRYLGNVTLAEGADTRCAACDLLLITRRGFTLTDDLTDDGHCPSCRRPLYGKYRPTRSK